MQVDFRQAHSAAVLALCGMAIRQLLADASETDPAVVSVRLAAVYSADGVELSFEAIDRNGLAVAGAAL